MAAGKDGNRTSFTDIRNGGTPTTVNYCYDNADRLTATSVANAPTGPNPLLALPRVLVVALSTGFNVPAIMIVGLAQG